MDIGCVDLDTKVQQLLFQFERTKVVPMEELVHRFDILLSRVWHCSIQIATFDPRGYSLTVPRMEVAIERKRREKKDSNAPSAQSFDYLGMRAINPHEADAADKFGFRNFLATSLARRRRGHKFVVIAPDNTIHGDHELCDLLAPIAAYTEGDTRIPAALVALRNAELITDSSRVGLWTNDTDSLWMAGSVGQLAEFCLFRPNNGAKKEVVIDLIKLKNVIERKFGCNYISWLFWICLFRATDYTSPPPGFCSIGNREPPPREDLIRLDQDRKILSFNRRQLRAVMFYAAKRNVNHAQVIKHFDRLAWSAAFYLLLQPKPERFGWTSQPFVFEPKNVLELETLVPRDSDGWMDLFFE